jgi:hypothetical protein
MARAVIVMARAVIVMARAVIVMARAVIVMARLVRATATGTVLAWSPGRARDDVGKGAGSKLWMIKPGWAPFAARMAATM